MNKLIDDVRRDAISKSYQCIETTTDQALLRDMVYILMSINLAAKRDGLLAVENLLAEITDDFQPNGLLKRAVLLMVDGTDPVILEEILTNMYWTDGVTGINALSYYLVIRCIQLTQEGAAYFAIDAICQSLIPVACYQAAKAKLDVNLEALQREHDAIVMKAFPNIHITVESEDGLEKLQYLEKKLCETSDFNIQRMLREISNSDLIMALVALSADGRDRILTNCSKRLSVMLKDDVYQNYSDWKEAEIIEAINVLAIHSTI